MKGIILAGGTGSRLFPLTSVTNKHLLPVGRYPMIYHAIDKLKTAGITEIMVITGKEHAGDVIGLLGSGVDIGVSFTYKVQDKAGGIAQALGLAERFVADDRVVVILGDNVFSGSITMYVDEFNGQPRGAKILIKKVEDPQRFGVPTIENNLITSIVEKPQHPSSDYAVTGIYMYDPFVFDIIRSLRPSARGELEITDVNNAYISKGQLTYAIINDWWTDAGTHASLAKANELAKDIILSTEFGQFKL
jgi:glucose-1-phosphate thymidylyltransferase